MPTCKKYKTGEQCDHAYLEDELRISLTFGEEDLMPNRAYLAMRNEESVDRDYDLDSEILCGASMEIPLLWWGIFTPEDVRVVDLGDGFKCPFLLTTAEMARHRIHQSEPALLKRIPRELRAHVRDWSSLMSSVDRTFICLDTFEIWDLGPAEFDSEVETSLQAFATFDKKTWDGLLGRHGIRQTGFWRKAQFDPEAVAFSIRGYKWVREVPWKE